MKIDFECKINHSCISENNFYKDSEFSKYEITYPKLVIYPKFVYHNDYDKYIIRGINEAFCNDSINLKEHIEKQASDYEENFTQCHFKYQYEAYMEFKTTYDENYIISIPQIIKKL